MYKVLVANRGEIALRIIKTLKKLNIKSVAIYSEADRNSPHIRLADEVFLLGPSPSSQSYLNQEKILEFAKNAGVDAIHPGYGFLSENASFASKVTDAGMVFIGPLPETIKLMGSKLEAKAAVSLFNVPMASGSEEPVNGHKEALIIAEKIGFPVLIKASAGGGGKGMRIVHDAKELKEQFERAVSEAISAFGDGSVFIEKYISSPRHIEIQVLADNYGNVVYLNERECSIQRRHQKVIEEAPSSIVSAQLRKEIGQAAVNVAKACNYRGAGTVEFLMDENKKFYFLEMNTRLQVEHPVTEMTTGLDLVEEQIKIADGNVLSFNQEDVKLNGHAIELRVYAEDPEDNFLPSIGTLSEYREPKGEKIRVDSGYKEGMEIPIFYDPMISKLIVHGENRDKAISLMKYAISRYRIKGIKTTLPFGEYVMEHPAFIKGDFNTNFINLYLDTDKILNSQYEASKVASLFTLKYYRDSVETIREPKHDVGDW